MTDYRVAREKKIKCRKEKERNALKGESTLGFLLEPFIKVWSLKACAFSLMSIFFHLKALLKTSDRECDCFVHLCAEKTSQHHHNTIVLMVMLIAAALKENMTSWIVFRGKG